ncbi:MAG: 30S ribosomal protein S12 methylthiotransferase RimO [Clostridia bacterium]|jgi:ribosomal protein S12 methylthiotransferase|nr:30S ribosomal protein S12 methylthiotransferase RimO [Clostridia bacterium]
MIDFTGKKFGLISLGCDKNRVDSEKALAIISSRGGVITNDAEDAQILIINTCAFLNEARKEAIETVLEYAAYKSKNLEKLVVTGCLPQKFVGETFPALTEADVFLGTNDYDKLFEALEKSYESGRVNFVGTGDGSCVINRVVTTPLHYAYLKIADGCNNRCTYCLIPKIRGRYQSYPIEKLLEEVEALGDVSELILVAQDVTRYGVDLYGQKKLVDFLRKVTTCGNINSVRLLYCYPDMIDDELIAEIRDNPKIIKYIDIPLQHSEDVILKLMNRPAGREKYLKLIEKLRNEIPDIAIRSTFIAGFPTESEESFEGLCSFIRQAKLNNCGFFAYSREPDTAAFKLKGQLPYCVKKKRVKKLYEIQREISRETLEKLVGSSVKVVCDGIDYGRGCFVGRAYFQAPEIDGKVYFNAPSAEQGKYYKVIINGTDGYDLFGRTEDYCNE